MQWINVKERLPNSSGHYTVITKPILGKWSQRYTTQMYYSHTYGWSNEYTQSKPIHWLEVGKLPGPTSKKRA